MKPIELKPPFTWDNRQILIHDRIFYVPSRGCDYKTFTFPGWQDPLLFGNDNPIHVEYCSGNGEWIAAKAQENPHINWVAVEKKFVRVRKIWAKIKNLNLPNLIVLCGEACNATRLYFPDHSFVGAYINFPDPWPKKRHAKNRLIRPEFVEQIWRVLGSEKIFTLVTDDPDYSSRMIAEMETHSGFTSLHPFPHFTTEMPNYGTSWFEILWREKGRMIHFHQYQKLCSA